MYSQDDASALDLPTLRRWNLLLRVFFCEYLDLQPDAAAGAKRDAHARLREVPHPHRGEEPPTSSTPPESERVTGARPDVRRSDSELVSILCLSGEFFLCVEMLMCVLSRRS